MFLPLLQRFRNSLSVASSPGGGQRGLSEVSADRKAASDFLKPLNNCASSKREVFILVEG